MAATTQVPPRRYVLGGIARRYVPGGWRVADTRTFPYGETVELYDRTPKKTRYGRRWVDSPRFRKLR